MGLQGMSSECPHHEVTLELNQQHPALKAGAQPMGRVLGADGRSLIVSSSVAVEPAGIEPAISGMPSRRSPD